MCCTESCIYFRGERPLWLRTTEGGNEGIMVGEVDTVVHMRLDGHKRGIGQNVVNAHIHRIAIERARNPIAGRTKRIAKTELHQATSSRRNGGVVEISANEFHLSAAGIDKTRERVDHVGPRSGSQLDFVVKSALPSTRIGTLPRLRPLAELPALVKRQGVGTQMTVDHDPGALVGHLQPKGDHYIAARATNELRIRDGKLRNESEAFAPRVVALVVGGARSFQSGHQFFVLFQRPHALLKGNDLRAGSDHVVRHFSPPAVGQSEAARVVGHDPNFARSHAARTASVEIDRRISADAA